MDDYVHNKMRNTNPLLCYKLKVDTALKVKTYYMGYTELYAFKTSSNM